MSRHIDDPTRGAGEPDWRSFTRALAGTTIGTSLLLYLLVLLIDPYDEFPLSPDWERYPVTSQARPYNAKLARSGRFDSAVVGNSTSMLLKPQELNKAFGGRFVNLAMPAASPYEQLRMLELMSFDETYTGTLIVGLDPFWCAPDGSARLLPPMVPFGFPDRLYDDDPWNNLPPFNEKTLQHARSQLKALIGHRIRYPLRPDGYRDFTATYRPGTNPETVRQRIYGEEPWPLERTKAGGAPAFPELDALANALRRFSPETRKIAYFVPFHVHHQAKPGTEQHRLWTACKVKAAKVLGTLPNTLVLDFLIPSPITMVDTNYIDAQHYTTPIASRLAGLLSLATRHPEAADEYRVLNGAGDRQ